jgi:hypothetical protein
MTTRRQLRTTVELPVIETTAELLCSPKNYRDESWYTECAKTQEMPAISEEQAA